MNKLFAPTLLLALWTPIALTAPTGESNHEIAFGQENTQCQPGTEIKLRSSYEAPSGFHIISNRLTKADVQSYAGGETGCSVTPTLKKLDLFAHADCGSGEDARGRWIKASCIVSVTIAPD